MRVCWALGLEISIFFRACFQVTFVPLFESKFGRLGLLKPGVRIEGIAKHFVFTENVFYGFRDRHVSFFGGLGRSLFSIFVALETASKIDGCSVV